jgi:hypothetical protein
MAGSNGTSVKNNTGITFPAALKYTAAFISYFFHPLFIPVYVGWFWIYVANFFSERSDFDNIKLMISLAVNYAVLPLVTLLLAKTLGFVRSIYLRTPKDRIIPYIASGIFYFWIWYVFHNQNFPPEIEMFSLAVFLASSIGLIANAFLMVSMHAMSVGVMATYILMLGFSTYKNFGPYISIAFFIAGLVCTARLIHSNHTVKEIYTGLAIGAVSQVVASWFA